jgi:hypothetical protein
MSGCNFSDNHSNDDSGTNANGGAITVHRRTSANHGPQRFEDRAETAITGHRGTD